MVEEAAHEQRHVERNELMDDAGRQPLFGKSPEVTVPVVTSTLKPRARMRSTSGSTLSEFADARAMHPDQRARAAARSRSPRRSASRARCSLPRRSRRASSSGANGVAAAVNSR